MNIQFGTEGWRAIIDKGFNLENVQICAQATADLVKNRNPSDSPQLIIGYDTRLKSDEFAKSVAEVFAGNSITVLLNDKAVPTPVISHAVWSGNVAGGVIITASHNPANYNGYKLKMPDGASASSEIISQLEHYIRLQEKNRVINKLPLDVAMKSGLVKKTDLGSAYIEHLENSLDLDRIRSAGIKIIHDPMYGSGIGYFSQILNQGTTKVKNIHGVKDSSFPRLNQPEPVENNLTELSKAVKSNNYDIGIANDGDADRVGIVDEAGRVVTALETFALICLYQLEVLKKRGPIIRSITQTSMIDKLGEIYGVPVIQTEVGFKHIAPLIKSHGALVAGEESGGFTIDGHMPDRDGILSGILILDMIAQTGKSVTELIDWLFKLVGCHYYKRIDTEFNLNHREEILLKLSAGNFTSLGGMELDSINTMDGFKFNLKNGAWMLIRFSGTEPLLRTYAEGNSLEEVNSLLQAAQEIISV